MWYRLAYTEGMNNAASIAPQAETEPAFRIGHAVVAKGLPFWMTVKHILPGGHRFSCTFGSSDKPAGVFADIELDFKRCIVATCREPLVHPMFDKCSACLRAEDRGPFQFDRDES